MSRLHVTRVLAPNPGPYTGPGTNTYVVERGGEALIIDPGPVDTGHLDAIVETVGETTAAGVLVTHTHPDHAPAANPLARRLAVPVYGWDRGPEFEPDVRLGDGEDVLVGGVPVTAVYTPGHSDDHLCYLVERVLFTGDHIMGGSSVMIEDLTAYLASLRRLQELDLARLCPGHGPESDAPQEVVSAYLAHRAEREREVLEALAAGASTVGEVVEHVYRDVDPALHPLAARSVVAHLVKLADDGVAFVGEEPKNGAWHRRVALLEETP